MGVLGNAGINAPLYVYVARWFDRRRGSALALIASGQAAAGTIWAPLFGHAIQAFGWRDTMQLYAGFAVVVILPAAFVVFGPPPEPLTGGATGAGPAPRTAVLGLAAHRARPDRAGGLSVLRADGDAARPSGRLLRRFGIPVTQGAAMLSLLLACAFIGRQFWGFVADRFGGLRTVLAGSACQAVAMAGFLSTQNEAGLFAVSAVFGLGFSGIIPAYVVAVRELFPASEASWRIPTVLLFSGSGMAAGGWLAGVIYDTPGSTPRPSPPGSSSTSPISWSSARWCSAKAACFPGAAST